MEEKSLLLNGDWSLGLQISDLNFKFWNRLSRLYNPYDPYIGIVMYNPILMNFEVFFIFIFYPPISILEILKILSKIFFGALKWRKINGPYIVSMYIKSCLSYLMVSLKINLVCIRAMNPSQTWNSIAVSKSGLRKLVSFWKFLDRPRTTRKSTSCWGLIKVLKYSIHTPDQINFPGKSLLQIEKIEVVSSAEVRDS